MKAIRASTIKSITSHLAMVIENPAIPFCTQHKCNQRQNEEQYR